MKHLVLILALAGSLAVPARAQTRSGGTRSSPQSRPGGAAPRPAAVETNDYAGDPGPELEKFFAAKESHGRELARKLKLEVHPDVWRYLDLGSRGNWRATTNLFDRLKQVASQYEGAGDDPRVGTPVFQTVIETTCAYDFLSTVPPALAKTYVRDVAGNFPPGAIYFGGTDPGRGVITAACKNHAVGDPFYVLTQNALADSRYLEYLRATFGDRLQLPGTNDLQRVFQDYLTEVAARREAGKLLPGEQVQVLEDGRVQVSGQTAVMAINAGLARLIFDRNPQHEFFLEESLPLDWTYPHLVPYGAIFRLNPVALERLPDAVIAQDREFWRRRTTELVGAWLQDNTSLDDVLAFARKVHGEKDRAGFKGSVDFIRSPTAQKTYAKLRAASADHYAWRQRQAKSEADRAALRRETDLAYRQALALCPSSPEAVHRYADWLVAEGRPAEARAVVETAARIAPGEVEFQRLLVSLAEKPPETKPGGGEGR